MSVATKNPFALLDEDASPPSAPAPLPAAPAAPPAPAREPRAPRGGPAARGGKYYPRGGKPSATAPLNTNGIEEPAAEPKRGGRGRGRGGPRGSGAPRGGRPFDRHSQTGKTDSDKKIHQSWGGDDGITELKAEEAATTDAAAEAAPGDWGAPAPAADWGAPADAPAADWSAPADAAPEGDKPEREGRPRREREPEEEDNTLTLEQYLAQKKASDAVPKLEGTRKANEGAGDDIWKDVKPLEKTEEDAFFVGKSKAAPKARAKKEEKVFLEIEARFERPSRGGRGGRGGFERGGDRGGDRRGRGRGGERGRGGRPNSGPAPVNVDDETAFPSLA